MSSISVFIYSQDVVLQAGLIELLRGRQEVILVDPAAIDAAHVALIGVDHVDEEVLRTVRAIQRNGCPRVGIVASLWDDESILACADAGAIGFLRRSEASAERLEALARSTAADESTVPTDVVGSLLRRWAGTVNANLTPAIGRLSSRETEVIRLVADGCDTAEIAALLHYSERTVKGIIHDVTARLRLKNRTHAVAYALRNDLI
jgi:DNA-binding NarL/FixJ family response regulator